MTSPAFYHEWDKFCCNYDLLILRHRKSTLDCLPYPQSLERAALMMMSRLPAV
jgi:hypothetical protein